MEYKERVRLALLDWSNELEYREKILLDPNVPEETKERARARIEEAKGWIRKIHEETGIRADTYDPEEPGIRSLHQPNVVESE